MVMKTVNNTFRDYLSCSPNDLMAVGSGFEGVFKPQLVVFELILFSTKFIKVLVATHEVILDQASLMIINHQNNVAS